MGNWILCLAIIFYSMFAMGETVKTFADSLYQEVLARDLGGSLDEQIKAFKNVIKLDNEYAPAYHKLAQLYLKQNTVISRQRAENAIRNARSIDPENTEYQLTWGEVMWARGFRFNSSEQYKRVLKNNPNNARAAYAVGFRALKEYLKYQDMIDYDQLIDSVVRFEWADFAKK